ncbi:MAG: M20/M25/M40 family metallo-hydrolase [Candidatus Gastranaerophilales bacterium]|nr:M20/M25/M40 family metallo-hydrolase [Candidatus Gastranaerophilales bacterium]
MDIDTLCGQHELYEIFCSLVKIPSPSLHEEKVIQWIQDFCKKNNLSCNLDEYKNVYISISATDSTKQPLMFSSHMDVVGDSSEVNLILDGEYIKANGRTLGADDKAGVAAALMLAKEVNSDKTLKHGGLEITFTRDEETNMSGIEHVDFSRIKSKYILVCDADKLAQVQISGASYTNAKLAVKALIGGHSGIDIGDKTRLNAAKLIAELLAEFPQGTFYQDETGVITSCNLGAIAAGGIQNAVKSIVDDNINSPDYITTIIDKASTNIINTDAKASYSIRSASVQKENELKQIMVGLVDEFNEKYKGLAEANITFEVHLPPFEKSDDDLIPELHTKVCKKLGIQNEVSSFHAGAETHIYAHNKNADGATFKPYLLGLADIYNMHSANEKVDYKTMLKGYSIIKELFLEFNSEKI